MYSMEVTWEMGHLDGTKRREQGIFETDNKVKMQEASKRLKQET